VSTNSGSCASTQRECFSLLSFDSDCWDGWLASLKGRDGLSVSNYAVVTSAMQGRAVTEAASLTGVHLDQVAVFDFVIAVVPPC
jgi:hypothetical protein